MSETIIQKIIETGLQESKWNENTARQHRHYFYQCVYDNSYKNYILDVINRINSIESIRVALAKRIQTDNTPKNIIDQISVVFESGIDFYIRDRNFEDNETWSKLFAELIKDCDLYALLPEIDRMLKLHYDLVLIPKVANGKFYIDIITPDRLLVVENKENPTTFDELYYLTSERINTPSATDRIDGYVGISLNGFMSFGYFDNQKKYKINRLLDTSGYGGLSPAVVFRNYYPKNSFFANRENEIIEVGLWHDLDTTNIQKLKDYSDPQLVLRGYKKSEVPTDRTSALTFEGNPTLNEGAEYISPNATYLEIQEQDDKRLNNLKMNLGLSKSQIQGETATSGYQLYLSKKGLYDKAKQDRVYYRKPLVELLEKIVVLARNLMPNKYGQLPEYGQFRINLDWKEQTFFMSPEEKERVRQMRILNGTSSIIDFILEDDPDLQTRDEAIEKYMRNLEENQMQPKQPESQFSDRVQE